MEAVMASLSHLVKEVYRRERSDWLEPAFEFLHMDSLEQSRFYSRLQKKDLSKEAKEEELLHITLEACIRVAAERGYFQQQDFSYIRSLYHTQTSLWWWFVLRVAAENADEQAVLEAIQYGEPRRIIDEEDRLVASPYMFDYLANAQLSWLYMTWRFLVEHGHLENTEEPWWIPRWEDLAVKKKAGWTFLHFAAAWGDMACIKVLLKMVGIRDTLDSLTEEEGYTALHLASYHDHAAIVTLLLEHSADANVGDWTTGRTPLHHASERGCFASVKALLEKANINVDAKDDNGMTALHLAACRGETEVVRALLSRTEDPNMKSGKVDLTCKKLFIGRSLQGMRDANNNLKDWGGISSRHNIHLFEACYASDATFLQPNSVKSEVWSPGGFTALHFAVVYGNDINTVREILEHGGGKEKLVTTKDSLGLTPADWAEVVDLKGAPELFQEIRMQALRDAGIKKGTQMQKSDHDGQSELDVESKVAFSVSFGKVTCFNLNKAVKLYEQVKEAEQERMKLQWALDMGEALWAKRWGEARRLTSQGVKEKIKIDDILWVHLKWAIDLTLEFQPTEEYRRSLIERMVVELVRGKAFSNSTSTMQTCLMWAIEHKMVDLVEAIVRDGGENKCDLLSVARGCDHQKSPLEAATDMGEDGVELVAVMEQQEDVKKRLYEDRQVYVDYANTILVGAVLIAALAYQGWVQQPQGYAALQPQLVADSMNSKGMLDFAWCNSWGYFLSMGTVMAGAVGAMPLRSGQLVRFRQKSVQAAAMGSLLMAAAVACEVVAFASGVVSVNKSHHSGMVLSATFGAILVFMLSAWFLTHVNELLPFHRMFYNVSRDLLQFSRDLLQFCRDLPKCLLEFYEVCQALLFRMPSSILSDVFMFLLIVLFIAPLKLLVFNPFYVYVFTPFYVYVLNPFYAYVFTPCYVYVLNPFYVYVLNPYVFTPCYVYVLNPFYVYVLNPYVFTPFCVYVFRPVCLYIRSLDFQLFINSALSCLSTSRQSLSQAFPLFIRYIQHLCRGLIRSIQFLNFKTDELFQTHWNIDLCL